MCGIIGALLCLYCKSGCRASVVASALAFHPPEPYYEFKYDLEKKEFTVNFSNELSPVSYPNTRVTMIETKNRTKVPIIYLTHPEAKYTLLFSHGNATDCGAMYAVYVMLASMLKINVVGYDYTGYGASMEFSIRPTEHQIYQDIESVYDWCLSTKLVSDPGNEIILYGQSVGSGPSCYLASIKPVAGLILHSPILSGLRVLTRNRALWCFDIFPNIRRIKNVKSPVYVIHGEDDDEVTVDHGQELLEAVKFEYKYPAWWVPKKGHNDVILGNEHEYIRRLKSYLLYLDQFKENMKMNKSVLKSDKDNEIQLDSVLNIKG